MRTPRGSSRYALLFALTLVAGLSASCKSSSSNEDTAKAKESDQPVNVHVTGGTATTNADGTITLNYPESDDINDRIPDWVINPAMGGVTGAVGVAPANDLGMREQLDEARLSGRLELASMLELRVQRVGRSELEQDSRVEGSKPAGSSRRSTLGVDRNILDSVLAGSRQRALWIDEKSGECFVWMVLDGALLERVDHRVVKDVSVFTANQALPSEYKPKRMKMEPPTVVVEMPKAAAPAPPPPAPVVPEAPLEPIEELEGNLKPIETIPLKPSESGN